MMWNDQGTRCKVRIQTARKPEAEQCGSAISHQDFCLTRSTGTGPTTSPRILAEKPRLCAKPGDNTEPEGAFTLRPGRQIP